MKNEMKEMSPCQLKKSELKKICGGDGTKTIQIIVNGRIIIIRV
jgi:hypothetical protein